MVLRTEASRRRMTRWDETPEIPEDSLAAVGQRDCHANKRCNSR